MVEKEDFVAWKNDPVTKAVMQEVRNLQSEMSEFVMNGGCGGSDYDTAVQIGKYVGLGMLLEVDHEDIIR